jgi:hypothetical protein
MGKKQRLGPFPFPGPMLPSVDDVMKKLFLILGQRYQISFP